MKEIKGKAICLVRVSTERQVDEEQQLNLRAEAERDGYSDIEIIEEKESGFKNEEDRLGLNRLKDTIEAGGVSIVYARHIDRIARKKKVLFSVLEYLQQKKIQLRIIDPYIKMLNDDGTINEGAEMLFTFYAQLAESEMRIKKLRFKEGKDKLRKQNLFTGHNLLFGYEVVDKTFVIKEEEAFYVRKMFELYNKGYSQRRVLRELRALGYQGSSNLTQRNIHNRAYCGKGTEAGIIYPAIISEQVFDEAQRVSTSKRYNVVSMSRDVLCRQLILCQDCGHYYGVQASLYRCANGSGKGRNTEIECSNNCGISVITLDKFIWSICAEEYITLLVRTRKDNKRRKNEENDILTRKAKKLQEDIDSNNEKKETLLNNYINGDITKNQYDKSLNKLASVISEKNNELASIRARINDNRMEEEMILDSQQFTRKKMRDIEQMPQTDCARASRIVHKVIKKIELEKSSFVDKKVIIYYNDGRIERYEYKPKKVFFEDKFKLISEQ